MLLASRMKRAHQRAHAIAHGCLAPMGLTPARFDLLSLVHASRDPPRQRDLQRALGVTAATLSRMLGQLEELGLVTRRHDVDRRRKSVGLTEEGLSRVTHAARAIDAITNVELAPFVVEPREAC